MDVMAIIPARGGSKGIPRKNLRLVGGRPLVDWVIDAANDSRAITTGVLSSDDSEIRDCATGKIEGQYREPYVSGDAVSTEAVIEYVLGEPRNLGKADIYVLLQPTSPLTRGSDIDTAVELLIAHHADSVVSVVPTHALLWDVDGPLFDPQHRPRRQDMGPRFEENGAIYVFTCELWQREHCRMGGKMVPYLMGEQHRYQIDTPLDMELVSWLLSRQEVPA